MMSATSGTTPTNPPKSTQNKRSRKKKSVVGPSVSIPNGTGSTTDPATPVENGAPEAPTPAGQAFFNELAKRTRRYQKKMESIKKDEEKIKDLTPEELATTTVLNKDQLAKIRHKPETEAVYNELSSLHDLYRSEFETIQQSFAQRQEARDAEHEKQLAAAVKEAREQGLETGRQEKEAETKSHLMSLLKFLRLAGYRRACPSENSDEDKAVEAVLVQVYSGDDTALAAALSIEAGSSDHVDEENLVAYARIKHMAYDLCLEDESAETEHQEPVASDEATVKHDTTTVNEKSGDYVEVTQPSDLQSQPEVLETAAEPAQEELKEEPEQEPTVIAEALDAESKAVEAAIPEQVTAAIPPASVQEQDSQSSPTAEAVADLNQDGASVPAIENNGHQRSSDEFQHVERRGGRGRGGHRGGRGDGFFRGNTRARGNFRGDGRGGEHRGRGSFRSRGRGGQQQQTPAPIAAQQ